MTQTMSSGVQALRAAMSGAVLVPGQSGYEEARSIWNGDIDRHPALIARCESSADVSAAVRVGREQGWEISVRGGGHGYSGKAVTEGGLMIDLSVLTDVVVDPVTRRARCGGGCHWADVDAATQAHGLAVTGGMISHTGIGGLTLGGGVGWLTRRHGLVIDNLVSAEVVLADGRVVRASGEQYPDLFWALRGGGGNFGVVTEFEYELHPVGPVVHVGMFFWPVEQADAALRLGRDVIDALGRDLTGFAVALNAPPAPFVPEQHHLAPGVAVVIVGLGTTAEHAAAVGPVRDGLAPLFELVTPMPYVGLQQMLDDGFPWGCLAYANGLTFDEFSDEVIAVIAEHLPAKTSPLTALPMFLLGGAYAEVGDDDTAFGGRRSARCLLGMDVIATDSVALAADRTWARNLLGALQPLARDSGAYVNVLYDAEHDRVRDSYGPDKYDRLARIKAEYDPDNLFHLNANITPSASSNEPGISSRL